MFLKRGMIVIQPFRWIGMQNTNLLHAGMLHGFSRAVITVFISHRFDDHSGRLSVRSPCCDNEIRQDIFLFTININFCIKQGLSRLNSGVHGFLLSQLARIQKSSERVSFQFAVHRHRTCQLIKSMSIPFTADDSAIGTPAKSKNNPVRGRIPPCASPLILIPRTGLMT